MKILHFLGPKGSFSHQAADHIARATQLVLNEKASIAQVIREVEVKPADFGLVPIENSQEGGVHESLDRLFRTKQVTPIQVIAEVRLMIQHHLIGRKGQAITHIYSHPQALAQVADYLEQHYPNAQLHQTASTSQAVQYLADHPYLEAAAIGNSKAASQYDLTILDHGIQDSPHNQTRFWLLACDTGLELVKSSPESQQFSFILRPKSDHPGSLYQALASLSAYGINLIRIESRPLKTQLGAYFFLLESDSAYETAEPALLELRSKGYGIQVLGAYPVYTL